ncbi:MAG: hypothetical protein IMW98_02135 [Firmicutes bacterium]|nr:hypothetical protein [Bacillota bacterium]
MAAGPPDGFDNARRAAQDAWRAAQRAGRAATDWLSRQPWLKRVAGWLGSDDWRVGAGAVAAGLVLVLGLVSALRPGPARTPLMPGVTRVSIIGYFENGWSAEFGDSFPSVQQHYRLLDEVLAFWYSVDGTGDIVQDVSRETVIRFVKSHGLKMGFLINNRQGDGATNYSMLTDPAARDRAIANIAGIVRNRGYDAVDVDFELIPPETNVDMTKFVCLLRRALPARTELSAAVFPPLDVDVSVNGAYDYKALSDCTDYLVIMLYDFHYAGGPPGPLSPDRWTRRNVEWLLGHGVPAKKIVVAAGLYGLDWNLDAGNLAQERALDGILGLASDEGVTPKRDPQSGNPYFEYVDDNGNRHIVWYMDAGTLRTRIALVKEKGLRGIALWRLGYEVPHVWTTIRETAR